MRNQAIPTFDDGGPTPDVPGTDSQPETLGNLGGVPVSPSTISEAMGSPAGSGPNSASANQPETLGNLGGAPVAPSTVANATQKLQAYITGKGAMDKPTFDKLMADSNGDPATAVATANKQNPASGSAALQSMRQHWDAYRGSAAKALAEGNTELAASEGTKAFSNVPDGTKTMITPGRDGNFTTTVHTVDGQDNTYNLTAEQLGQVFKGAHGLYDHVLGAGTNKILSSAQSQAGVSQAGTPQVSQEGPNGEQQQVGRQYPGNVAPSAKDVTASQNLGPSKFTGKQTDIGATLGQSGAPVTKGPQDATGEWTDSEHVRHVRPLWGLNADGTRDNSPAAGEESPINITRAGVTRQEGNAARVPGASDAMTQLARQNHPNDPRGQSEFITGQLNEGQKQKNALDISRQRGADAAAERGDAMQGAATTRAQGGIQEALIKAASVANGTNTRFQGEQGRDAANILKQMMHDNPQAPIGDQIAALRKGNINDDLIKHLVNPSETAPTAQQAPQRRQQAPAQQSAPQEAPVPEQRQAGSVYNTPKGPLKWTGTGWIHP